jgi:hypothetical protein
MTETQEQVLNRLLGNMRSGKADDRIAALEELRGLNYSSPAILQQLERMALNDPSKAAQAEARNALAAPIHRHIRGRLSSLSRTERQHLLEEIESWEQDELIGPEQAGILSQRYNFDFLPAVPPAPAPVERIPAPVQATPQPRPAQPSGPQPTLTERLLSQASINVFLYLGAFLVIGAALILAALVQAARLPILSGVTVIFAAGAIVLKKRLPQPSFALFIVFSFLLPILANVLGDSLDLTGQTANAYWSLVLFAMALIWGFGTWFYSSRLFSLASFLSLSLALLRFVEIFGAAFDWDVLCLTLSTLIGLLGVQLLKGWKDSKFALPLFVGGQLVQALALFVSTASVVIHLINSDASSSTWIAITLTWLAAACFYVWSGSLFQFELFSWASAASLLPVSWLTLHIFHASAPSQILGLWVWGATFAAVSEVAARSKTAKAGAFSLPFLLGSLPLFATAAAWGSSDKILYGFLCLGATALVYAVLHGVRPRAWVWAAALVFGLIAYLLAFQLPPLINAHISPVYRTLGASLLLLIPELFFKSPLTSASSWRWPPFIIGLPITLICVGMAISAGDQAATSSVTFAVYTLLFAAHAWHFQEPRAGYLATASAALSVRFAYLQTASDQWLPIFTGLAILYFAAGLLLRRDEKTRAWGGMFRTSGLVLGAMISLAALTMLKETGGWYVAAVGALFLVEVFVRPEDRMEAAGPALFSIAAFLILREFHVHVFVYYMLVISLIWLTADALYARTLKLRRLPGITRAIAGTLALGNALALIGPDPEARQAALCFGVYALVFAFDAWFYRKPVLGYAATASLPLSVFFILQALGKENWLYEIVALATLYYAAGYILRRREGLQGWSRMLLYSGLGLGVINSLSAPLQAGLGAVIPVAIAATLFATEALARRDVRLGFPANLLYFEAYALILTSLKVDEPQFFSMGAAVLGMLMHYLLRRARSGAGAFVTGMFSQLVLLGTTFVQLYSTEKLGFFVVIFLQGLAVLIYGVVIRSRSLVIAPIIFIVLSVFTVVYGVLKGISTVILIGCTGVLLLLLGILAVILRERITRIGERFSDWQA